ncbi:MAG: PEP-CTERM sorting domain-containing protein [Phycisphaerae bacterium]
MKSSKIILSFLIGIMLAASAPASWTPLTGTVTVGSLQGTTLTVGDKVFSGFNVDIITVSGGAILPDPNLLTVQGVIWNETGDFGLRFDGVSWDVGSNQTISVNLSFKVSIDTQPQYDDYFIKDVWLYLTGGWAFGTGITGVGENVWANFPGDMDPVASLSCWATSSGNRLSDYKEFDPLKEVYIQTKTLYVSGGANGVAHFNEFFQFYSQVPEPATLALIGLGGVFTLFRRKHKA